MANDSKIVITAGLQIPETVGDISKDLNKVAEQLTGKLKISAQLNTQATGALIQKQLNAISKNLKIDVPKINAAISNPVVNNTTQQPTATNTISTMYAQGAKQADVLHRKQLLLQQDYDILAEKITKTNQNINTIATRDGVNYNTQFQQLMSGVIADNDTYNRARDALSAIRKEFQLLNAQFSSDLPENAIERYANRVVKLKSEIDLLAQSYKELGIKNDGLKSNIDLLLNQKNLLTIPNENEVTTKEELSQRTKQYTQIKTLVDEINIELQKQKKIESDFNKEFNAALKEEERQAKADAKFKKEYAAELVKEIEAEKERLAIQKQQAELPSQMYWQDQFNQSIKSMTAENEEAKKLKEYLLEIDAIEKERKQQAELPSQMYWQNQFEQSVKSLTAENAELKQLKEYLLEADKAAKQLESDLDVSKKNINTSINRLDTQSNNAIFRNNRSNADVQNQLQDIEQLKQKYLSLKQTIEQNPNNETLLSKSFAELSKLDKEFENVITSSKKLQASLRGNNATQNLNDRITKLTATMGAFAAANERAVNSTKIMRNGSSFADEWKNLSDILNKGNLDANSLRSLQARFQTFGKEAEEAGLKGKNAWGKFLDTFKTFSTYISANMVFNAFTRQIREMTQEVIKLDSAMVELRKVSDATDEEYTQFLNDADKIGKSLGSSISDVVSATAEFSRSGYGLPDAEELGRVATLYKNIGDGIDINTASETLVSTLKAFNKEASEAESIIDAINNVSNNASISSGGIGEGLQKTASALSVANNSLEESIALITTAKFYWLNVQKCA